MERDFHLNAEEALAFGIADRIQKPRPKQPEDEAPAVFSSPPEVSVPPNEEVVEELGKEKKPEAVV
jgi:hypothetical protein